MNTDILRCVWRMFCLYIFIKLSIYITIESKIVCLWISANPEENRDFDSIAKFFKIWHEYKRGSYHGLHEFYFLNHYIMLFNAGFGVERSKSLPTKENSFAVLKPTDVHVLPKQMFDISVLNDKILAQEVAIEAEKASNGQKEELVVVRAPMAGMNCQEVS